MWQADEKLAGVAEQLRKGVAQKETVRSFLSWFGAERRGFRVIRRIRNALGHHGLTTSPDFEWAYIDGLVSFQKAPLEGLPSQATVDAPDPSYRVGRLTSANRTPVSVAPDSPLQHVITLMMSNDYSQLPVMAGPRDLKGAVSWKTIGTRLALKRPCLYARDCMEDAEVLTLEDSLFATISIVATHDYVLILAPDKTICGIVTASDLNEQFRTLAEPFLLVGEIENGIRRLLHGKFTGQELEAARAPGNESRAIETPADLTFGEDVRLLEQEANWRKLKLHIDRVAFIKQLNRVRDIRNDVMHFDPDGLEKEDLKVLQEFAQFLKRLRDVGAV